MKVTVARKSMSGCKVLESLQRLAPLHIALYFLEDFRDLFNRLQDFRRRFALRRQVADQEQQGFHSFQVAHGFPAHRLVGMKQHLLPVGEARTVNDLSAQNFSRPLQVGQNGFFIVVRFGEEGHRVLSQR